MGEVWGGKRMEGAWIRKTRDGERQGMGKENVCWKGYGKGEGERNWEKENQILASKIKSLIHQQHVWEKGTSCLGHKTNKSRSMKGSRYTTNHML